MNTGTGQTKTSVQFIEITEEISGQRIDNFLINRLKHLPKSVIYRLLRKGEIRVNKKRIKPEYKLQENDLLRLPPINLPEVQEKAAPSTKLSRVSMLENSVIFEDEHLLILNKPSGTAVHGGSGLSFGAIEAMRALRPDARFLELVHRIDRDTSGILLIAKKRSALRHLQAQFREKTVRKYYLALVMGNWPSKIKKVNAPLLKNETNSIVRVNPNGKASETHFRLIETFKEASLIKASPVTGRTHQIRVHAQYAGHPLAWDDRYGDVRFDAYTKKYGLERLFLHAASIQFLHPATEQEITIEAPLEPKLENVLEKMRKCHQQ